MTLGAAGAGVGLAIFAASAFANAANPTPPSSGTIAPGPGGSVTVTVSGTWSWGELAGVKTSPQNDCAGRSGVGWAVDWWGMSNSPTAASIPGLTGDEISPPSSTSTPPPLSTQTLTPAGALQTPSGQYFHVSQYYNGFDHDLCSHTDSNGAPIGTWSSTATYPSAASVPAKLCVNFYDPHGKQDQYKTDPKEYSSTDQSDNSIQKNDFDPAQTAYCFAPTFSHPLSITVDKTNDANADGTYSKTETANSAGQSVKFQVVVKNTSTQAVAVIDSPITDTYNGSTINVCDGSTNATVTKDDKITGDTLQPGASETCQFTIANYAPGAGSLDNTVKVNVHEQGLDTNKASDQSTSTVNAPSKATLASKILLCSDGSMVGGGNLAVTGPTSVTAGQQIPATPVDAGSYTVNATAPAHYALTPCPAHGYSGTPTQSVTLKPGDNKELDFYVVKLTPNVSVAKDGPATGLLNGTGTYHLVATNGGTDASDPTTVTDTLPAGETFVAAGSSSECTAAGQTVSCTLGSLAANGGSKSFTVVVSYSKTGSLTDCATVNNQPNPSCVTTVVQSPNVTVAKSGPATGVLGNNGSYTIVATNNGDAASQATTFTDTLPSGETFVAAGSSTDCSASGQVVTCKLGALAAKGGSQSFTVVVSYSATGALTDCATIQGQANPSCVTTHVGAPKLNVVKSGPATGVLNGQGVYTIVASNTGDAPSTATTFTDTLPDGETFVSAGSSAGCSASGQVVTCNLPALGAKGTAGDSQSFTVVVSYSKTGALTDCATIAGQPSPSCVTTTVGAPNVTVVKSGPATGVLGGTGTYTLVASNIGNAASTPTTVFDVLPAGEEFVAAGSDAACSANGQVVSCALPALAAKGSAGDSQSFTVVVKYTAIGDQTDCASAPGQATQSCVTTHIPGNPTLTVVKTNDANGDGNFTDSEVSSAAGKSVTFQVVVTNTSNEDITIDTVSDAYAGTTANECANLIGTVLAAGDSVTCTFTIPNYSPAAGTSLTNTVTVSGHDVSGATTSAHDTSTVTTATPPTPGAPDLSIVKTATPGAVTVSTTSSPTLTYTLTVSNVGAGATTDTVTVTDTLPTGLSLVSVDGGTAWSCNNSGLSITCTYLDGAIQPGQTVPAITVTTKVLTTAPTVLVNTGVVHTLGDNNPTNDTSTVKTPVTKVFGEKIPKTPSTPSTPSLPFTGSNASQLVPVGLAAVILGFGLLLGGRRRRRRPTVG